ncbi:unnamed protein product [Moneuplotes crassus]|uniref:Uncharacterized protein n=1 Tax=Euplotes crassus TaxID=5936 RepID=A0AAD1U943_EUPCR|nr:unnamed protein product [Moneuplotes crassus]
MKYLFEKELFDSGLFSHLKGKGKPIGQRSMSIDFCKPIDTSYFDLYNEFSNSRELKNFIIIGGTSANKQGRYKHKIKKKTQKYNNLTILKSSLEVPKVSFTRKSHSKEAGKLKLDANKEKMKEIMDTLKLRMPKKLSTHHRNQSSHKIGYSYDFYNKGACLHSKIHNQNSQYRRQMSNNKYKRSICTMDTKSVLGIERKAEGSLTCKGKLEVNLKPRNYKNTIQQVRRIYGKEVTGVNSSICQKDHIRKRRSRQNAYSSNYTNCIIQKDPRSSVSIGRSRNGNSKIRHLKVCIDPDSARKHDVYTSFAQPERASIVATIKGPRFKVRSVPPKNKLIKSTKELFQEDFQRYATFWDKKRHPKALKPIKEPLKYPKQLISSPKVTNSRRKTGKRGLYLNPEKLFNSKTRRTFGTSSMKDSTRVSETYSNIHTNDGRKRGFVASSTRNMKRSENCLYKNKSSSKNLVSLDKIPRLKI